MYDGHLEDREWDLNDVGFTFIGVNSVCTREVRASFTETQETRRAARVRAPNTIQTFCLSQPSRP